jgi:tetratricopeptide (TPR) repeat protein
MPAARLWIAAAAAVLLTAGSPEPGFLIDPIAPARPAAAAADSVSEPTLFVPGRPDSSPPESEPAPLLIPGRPSPPDSLIRDRFVRAEEQFRLGLSMEKSSPGVAITAFRNALRLNPAIAEAHYRAGRLFMTRAQYGEAAKHFEAEIERRPAHEDATRQLGIALAHLGNPQRAVEVLERLLTRRRRDGATWHALGFAYGVAGRDRDAIAALRRAIALPPASAEEHRDLGALLAKTDRPREARTEYRRALGLAPGDAGTWFNIGNLDRRLGRPDDALLAYRRASSADSAFGAAYQAEIDLLRAQGRIAEAGEVYRRWLRNLPADHTVRLDAVSFFQGVGRHDVALEIARDGVREAGKAGEPHMIYGMALARHGDLREALRELRAAEAAFAGRAADRQRALQLIAALHAAAPDSLREVFRADSLDHATRQP